MPNHVTNVLAIRGDSKHVAEFLERIKNDKHGAGSVDFNKIIPMPAELSITAGSKTGSDLRKYREYISEGRCYSLSSRPQGVSRKLLCSRWMVWRQLPGENEKRESTRCARGYARVL